jgi:cell division protein FtsL
MRRTEEASGRFKALLSLAFLVAIIFLAIKTLPAYVNNFQLQDHIQRLSTQLAVRTKPVTPDEIRDEVVAFAQDHGVPLAADNVKVTISSHVSISLDYTVPVDLIVYTLRLHFTPSAENQSL